MIYRKKLLIKIFHIHHLFFHKKNFLAKKINEESFEVILEYLDNNKNNVTKNLQTYYIIYV